MIGKIRNFDKKKYEILSTSRIKMYDDEEKMQIKKTDKNILAAPIFFTLSFSKFLLDIR